MKKLMMALSAFAVAFGAMAANMEIVDGIEWTYAINDGKACVNGVSSQPIGAIRVPSCLGGYPVTDIGGEWFRECGYVTSVTIPACVETIHDDGYTPLARCGNLLSITVESGNVNYSSDGGVLYDKEMKELIQCPGGLKAVDIPLSVERIAVGAFEGCEKLTSVFIPQNVKSIREKTFIRCPKLQRIEVSSANMNFTSVEGVLYDKGMTVVRACPGAMKSFVIAAGVREIGEAAYMRCELLNSAVIPSGVVKIGARAFNGCVGLTTVKLPASVEEIGGLAFNRCTNLNQFQFEGLPPKGIGNMYEEDRIGANVMFIYPSLYEKEWMAEFARLDITNYKSFDPQGGDVDPGDWLVAHNFSGVVYDAGENCVGMIQIATKKATKKGVGVSGTMMLQDGKKITLKSMTVAPEGGVLNVVWTVKGYGKLNVAIGAEGFSGQFEDGGSVESQELDEDTGVLKASITMTYIDKKAGKLKTKKITFGGFVSGGEGVGTAQAGKKDPIKDVEFTVR